MQFTNLESLYHFVLYVNGISSVKGEGPQSHQVFVLYYDINF